MEIDTELSGGVRVLRPHGPLVKDDADRFSMEVRSARDESRGRLVVDCADMHFVDSSGLEALVSLADEFADAALVLRLAAANETVREVIDLTGLSESFELYADVHSAVRSFM
jgi:anti-anti-sigma factor